METEKKQNIRCAVIIPMIAAALFIMTALVPTVPSADHEFPIAGNGDGTPSDDPYDPLLYSVISSDTAAVTGFTSGLLTSAVVIPATVTISSVTYDVTSIGGKAFSGIFKTTSVTIPASVEQIEWNAFYNHISLKEFIVDPLNANYRSDGKALINEVTKTLMNYPRGATDVSYAIPSGIEHIADYAFFYCKASYVDIPDSVKDIGNGAFLSSNIVSADIPDSVTSIGTSAFKSCLMLTSVTMTDSVAELGEGAFMLCGNLVSAVLSDSMERIEGFTFSYCEKLASVNIPASLTYIGEKAFRVCESLTSVTIPSSVVFIGDRAFLGCESLTAIAIPEGASVGYKATGWTYMPKYSSTEAPMDVTVVYYQGVSALTAVLNGTDIDLTVHADDTESVIVGTQSGSDDVVVVGSGTSWSFAKQTEDVYYVTVTLHISMDPAAADEGGTSWSVLIIAACLLLMCIAAVLLMYRVKGIVTHNGKALEGVEIRYTLNGVSGTVTTDRNGRYVIHVSRTSEFVLTDAVKDGYTQYSVSVDGKDGSLPLSFTVEKVLTAVDIELV